MAKKLKKPRDLFILGKKYCVGHCQQEADRWFQLYSAGSLRPKTARRIAAWLLKAADWIEETQKGDKP